MNRLIKGRSKKAGLPPGALIHIGAKKTQEPKITIIDYDETHFEEKETKVIEECFLFREKPNVTWINVDGLHVEILEKLGECYGLHLLVLEDILNGEPARSLPACLAGQRACPPDDCGGTHGYAELLGIISNPDNEQYNDMMTWLGGHFYPASFDIEKVNRHLTPVRLK